MNFKSMFRTVPMAAVLLAGAMFSSPRAVLAAPSEEQVSRFDMEKAVTAELKQLRSLMNQLSHDADELNPLVHSGHHWQSHAVHLDAIKEDINRVGEQLEWLQTVQYAAAPWQQQVIDAVVPVAVQIADRTTAAIQHLNADRQYLWAPHYVDHLHKIPALSNQMRGVIDNHLKIVDAQERLAKIQGEAGERIS